MSFDAFRLDVDDRYLSELMRSVRMTREFHLVRIEDKCKGKKTHQTVSNVFTNLSLMHLFYPHCRRFRPELMLK